MLRVLSVLWWNTRSLYNSKCMNRPPSSTSLTSGQAGGYSMGCKMQQGTGKELCGCGMIHALRGSAHAWGAEIGCMLSTVSSSGASALLCHRKRCNVSVWLQYSCLNDYCAMCLYVHCMLQSLLDWQKTEGNHRGCWMVNHTLWIENPMRNPIVGLFCCAKLCWWDLMYSC